MSVLICPICQKEYVDNPKICSCGYEGLSFYRDDDRYFKEQWFQLYIFTKRVYTKQIPFAKSDLFLIEDKDCIVVDEVNTQLGLAIVDVDSAKESIASEGMLAFKRKTCALILNVDQIDYNMLDESNVRILYLGNKVKKFTDDYFKQKSFLRYIFVDDHNLFFTCERHVLFNKTKTLLYTYASLKDEVEYKVDSCVKCIKKYAFYYPTNLKKLYLPMGIRLESESILGDIQIIYY